MAHVLTAQNTACCSVTRPTPNTTPDRRRHTRALLATGAGAGGGHNLLLWVVAISELLVTLQTFTLPAVFSSAQMRANICKLLVDESGSL